MALATKYLKIMWVGGLCRLDSSVYLCEHSHAYTVSHFLERPPSFPVSSSGPHFEPDAYNLGTFPLLRYKPLHCSLSPIWGDIHVELVQGSMNPHYSECELYWSLYITYVFKTVYVLTFLELRKYYLLLKKSCCMLICDSWQKRRI